MQRTGVFGSAFNPPTRGHLDVIRQAAPRFDKILLVPSIAHAFHKQSIDIHLREQLLEAFCRDAKGIPCKLEVSLLEKSLLKQSPEYPVYTWTLLNHLSALEPDTEFSFIRGPDNASPETWKRFHRFKDIEQRWTIYTAKENIQARSSMVRELLGNGITESGQLKTLLSPSVMSLILEKKLYRSGNE